MLDPFGRLYDDKSGGIFIGAKIAPESCSLIRNYVSLLDIPNDTLLPNAEYHVTIIVSENMPEIEYPLVEDLDITIKAYDVRYIGKAIALLLISPWLRWRFAIAKACGLRSNFPGMIPHLSIAYDPPLDLPIAWWPKPNFEINLTKEYTEAMKKK